MDRYKLKRFLKKDSRDANIGVRVTTCLYRKSLGVPLKFNTVSTVLRKFDVLIKSEPEVVLK